MMRFFGPFLVLAVMAGCASGPALSPVAPSSLVAEDAPVVDYRLGVADKVRIKVFNEETLSDEFAVNANGAISFPLIGDVLAAGRTTSEVRDDIQRRLADGYLRNPRVGIDVLTFRPFYILGEVNKPGEYPYSTGLTADKAAATAGGFTYRAERKRVFIRHAGDPSEQAAVPSVMIRPGDTIRVGERYF
jgi:polysaccharide export outer membrane protein